MLTAAYPKIYLIKAISPELLRGNEATVYKPAFFLDVEGVLKWTFKDNWSMDDLREVKPGDERFLEMLPEEDFVGINEGENLYLLGEELYKTVSKVIIDGDIEFSLSAWKPFVHGYHVAVMTQCAFEAFRASLSYEIWPIIEDFIIAGSSFHPDLNAVFDAYDHLTSVEQHGKEIHALRAGAFFMVSGDVDRLTFHAWHSVKMDKLFVSEEAFADALDNYLSALRTSQSEIVH